MKVMKWSPRKKNTVESLRDGSSPERSNLIMNMLVNFCNRSTKNPATRFIFFSYFL
jgi:hypothetical protein